MILSCPFYVLLLMLAITGIKPAALYFSEWYLTKPTIGACNILVIRR